MRAMGELNTRQQAFVREYLLSGNASDAYRKAGYSAKDVDVAGPRLLGNVGVAAAIAEGRAKIEAKAEADFNLRLNDVLSELKRIAFSGMSKFLRITPDVDPIIDLSDCSPEDLDLLSEVTFEDFTDVRGEGARAARRIKIKPLSRMKALEKLGQHLGLADKPRSNPRNPIAEAIREISERGFAMPIRSESGCNVPAPASEETRETEP
jgi:phage terminase small subunit